MRGPAWDAILAGMRAGLGQMPAGPQTEAALASAVMRVIDDGTATSAVGKAIRQAAVDWRWSTERGLSAMLAGPLPVRLCQAMVAGAVAGSSATDQIALLLDDRRSEACLVAAVALGCLGDTRALAPLVDAFPHEQADMRLAAASALGRLGAQAARALPQLRDLAEHDRDRGVRQCAARAIGRIEAAARRGPAELVAAAEPEGRGTEPEAGAVPGGRGTEPEAG